MILHNYAALVLCVIELVLMIGAANWADKHGHGRAAGLSILALVASMAATICGLPIGSTTSALVCLAIAGVLFLLAALCRYVPALHE